MLVESRREIFTAAEKSDDDVAVGRHCVQSDAMLMLMLML